MQMADTIFMQVFNDWFDVLCRFFSNFFKNSISCVSYRKIRLYWLMITVVSHRQLTKS